MCLFKMTAAQMVVPVLYSESHEWPFGTNFLFKVGGHHTWDVFHSVLHPFIEGHICSPFASQRLEKDSSNMSLVANTDSGGFLLSLASPKIHLGIDGYNVDPTDRTQKKAKHCVEPGEQKQSVLT